MEKNWLIRTKSNHILGPVSKDKVLELFQNGTIKSDDELCSGNGYWFFIREDEMVSRFLTGDETQGFNPISEAKDVVTASAPLAPSPNKDHVTQIGSISTMLKEDKTPPPSMMSPDGQLIPAATKLSEAEVKKKVSEVLVKKSPARPKKVLKKQNYLKYVGVVCFLVLFLMVYFRRTIIKSLFHGEVTFSSLILSLAHAQEEVPEKKKSSLNNKSSTTK